VSAARDSDAEETGRLSLEVRAVRAELAYEVGLAGVDWVGSSVVSSACERREVGGAGRWGRSSRLGSEGGLGLIRSELSNELQWLRELRLEWYPIQSGDLVIGVSGCGGRLCWLSGVDRDWHPALGGGGQLDVPDSSHRHRPRPLINTTSNTVSLHIYSFLVVSSAPTRRACWAHQRPGRIPIPGVGWQRWPTFSRSVTNKQRASHPK